MPEIQVPQKPKTIAIAPSLHRALKIAVAKQQDVKLNEFVDGILWNAVGGKPKVKKAATSIPSK